LRDAVYSRDSDPCSLVSVQLSLSGTGLRLQSSNLLACITPIAPRIAFAAVDLASQKCELAKQESCSRGPDDEEQPSENSRPPFREPKPFLGWWSLILAVMTGVATLNIWIGPNEQRRWGRTGILLCVYQGVALSSLYHVRHVRGSAAIDSARWGWRGYALLPGLPEAAVYDGEVLWTTFATTCSLTGG
jgi:hypothetical protein